MKKAIVTGGTSGIGLGVAKMLIEKGYYVYVTYVGQDYTDQTDNMEPIKVDQTNREELYKFIHYIINVNQGHINTTVVNLYR